MLFSYLTFTKLQTSSFFLKKIESSSNKDKKIIRLRKTKKNVQVLASAEQAGSITAVVAAQRLTAQLGSCVTLSQAIYHRGTLLKEKGTQMASKPRSHAHKARTVLQPKPLEVLLITTR